MMMSRIFCDINYIKSSTEQKGARKFRSKTNAVSLATVTLTSLTNVNLRCVKGGGGGLLPS